MTKVYSCYNADYNWNFYHTFFAIHFWVRIKKWGSYLILAPNLKSDHVQVFVLKIFLKILKLIPKDTKIAEAKLEMILRIVVLASAGNKTIHHVCKNHKGTPTGVTVRNTLKLMFSDITGSYSAGYGAICFGRR